METFGNKLVAKSGIKFYCETCDYNTHKKYNYDKHNDSIKHKKATRKQECGNNNYCKITDDNKCETICDTMYSYDDKNKETKWKQISGNLVALVANEKNICENCEKNFSNRSGLWKHKKKCEIFLKKDSEKDNNNSMNELVKFLIKENNELKQMMIESHSKMLESQNNMIESQSNMMMEFMKNGTHNTTNNNTITNTNSNNKSFNLQVFLNETCKDAMNLTDFVNSLNITLDDFERFGSHGYVEGISNIFLKGLKKLDITKRPIHCSDLKRETIFLKEDNEWKKDDDQRNLIKKIIKSISNKNIKMIPLWKEANPTHSDITSKKNTQYLRILTESMGAYTEEENEINNNKIIKNVVKEVTIDKSNN